MTLQASPEALFEALQTTIKPDLLINALTHKSFANENPGSPNYERLEFLGDAVLELVTTEALYLMYDAIDEGSLTKYRADIVNETSLAHIARTKLNLGQYILLGHGEIATHGDHKDSILSDVVEALIAATYIEHGFDTAKRVVLNLIGEALQKPQTDTLPTDYKTALVIKAHELGLSEPEYHMEVSGPEYAPEYTAYVVVNQSEEPLAVGHGSSKRKAQLDAARIAVENLSASN